MRCGYLQRLATTLPFAGRLTRGRTCVLLQNPVSESFLQRRHALASPACRSIGTFSADKDVFLQNVERLQNGQHVQKLLVSQDETKSNEVFAHTDTPLQHIKLYGFDYDFTLATYNDRVLNFIYDTAKRYLVTKLGYDKELLNKHFDKSFAIRGLYYDERMGYLFKVDQFGKIATNTVHRGREPVHVRDIVTAYRGTQVTKAYARQYLHMMSDIFTLPEACLLADVIQLLQDGGQTDFSPRYVYDDVRLALDHTHGSGLLHNTIIKDPELYLDDNPHLGSYLTQLREAGKKVFMLTNSHYPFVDAGMKWLLRHMIEKKQIREWTELFDIIICNARKPHFFDRDSKFRRYDTKTGMLSFAPVSEFKPREVYTAEFTRLTATTGVNVLYMGDHVFADLLRPSKTAMWKTAAIVKEIQHEAAVMATPGYKNALTRLLEVENLIAYGQRIQEDAVRDVVVKLKAERGRLREVLKEMQNKYFGSPFRTQAHRTMFFFNVGLYGDVYTSSINNFLNYPMTHTFYAARSYFPHEEPPAPVGQV